MLGAIRLSRHRGAGDPTTSPARQRAKITRLVADRGDEIVGWAEDLGVSAVIPPMERPELGPWMVERADEYQGIIWASLDRAVRQMDDFNRIALWAADNRKLLIFGNTAERIGEDEVDSLDIDMRGGRMRQAMGKMILTLLSFAAEAELNNIRERNRDARHHMRQRGRWPGGMYPFHTTPVKEGGIWKLVINEETAPIVREAIGRVLRSESKNSIIEDFNARGLLSPREYRLEQSGKIPVATFEGVVAAVDGQTVKLHDPRSGALVEKIRVFPKNTELAVNVGELLAPGQRVTRPIVWNAQTLNNMLRARALIGQAEINGEMLIGPDGGPVKRVEPLIQDRDEWLLLQQRLEQGSIGNGRPRTAGASALLRVAFCARCGEPMYKRQQRRPGHQDPYFYYGCRSAWGYLKRQAKNERCSALAIDGYLLTEIVDLAVLGERGQEEVRELIQLPAEDHSADLADAQAALERTIEMAAGTKSKAVRATYMEMVTKAEARLTELAALPSLPRRSEFQGTGESYSDFWARATDAEKRQMLINNNVRVFAAADGIGQDALDQEIEKMRGGEYRARALRAEQFRAWLLWPGSQLGE